MEQFARQRAAAMAPSAATAEQRRQLSDAVIATQQLAEHGAAVGTLEKDDHAWPYWERFSRLYGWDPCIDAGYARACPDEVSQRLAMFQAWVYPQLQGRGGRPDAKPRSAFNGYVLAVIRILSREHVPMPKAKHVEKNLNGLLRCFKEIYGVSALMPGRKQPLTPGMWARIEGLAEGQLLAGRAPWSPSTRRRDLALLRVGRVLWRTGHRLGEIVAHPSGEINYLTRSCISIRKAAGAVIAAPARADWLAFTSGDAILLAPCPSKTDPFGEVHCMFPSILPFDGDTCSAAASVRDIELETPVVGDARRTTPLFQNEQGSPFTYAVLHKELRSLLAALYGPTLASTFSWHSVRIGLACSLHAAGCPDAVIQLICRWECPASLHVYRQMGIEQNIYWTDKANVAVFDALRVNNLPALDRMDQRDQAGPTPGHDGSPQRRAVPPAGAVAPAREVADSYPVPGGSVIATNRDANELVGRTVSIFNNFWRGHEGDFGRTPCPVVARCCREFRHPDGVRALSYLVQYGDLYYPIKHTALLGCLSADARAQLPPQRS
jgi:hypothetical protein